VREQETDSCHIHVRFTSSVVEFDYQDDSAIAVRFAAAAAGTGAIVTIDNDLWENLPPLPCRRLWT
jgi:hypothetical protein